MKSPAKIMRELADRIKFLRLQRHWSRQELAEYAKINVYSLKRFERTGNIALSRLLALAAALDALEDFNHILKPRERVQIDEWKVPTRVIRQRGRRVNRAKSAPTEPQSSELILIP